LHKNIETENNNQRRQQAERKTLQTVAHTLVHHTKGKKHIQIAKKYNNENCNGGSM
jgi:hypothetical protein